MTAVVFALAVALLALASGGLALDNGLGLTPPMGWNTWCTLGRCGRDYCDDKEIRSIADAMATNGMKEAGYEYINLDDCWADTRESDGSIVADKNRFPDGLKPVVQYLNSKGFKFGLYTDAGVYTCSQGERSHKIPGSFGHYQQDANSYADWGVEFVKMDWCNTRVNGSQLDPKVQYPQMTKALNTTGKKIFFNSCEWGEEDPWTWMPAYANSYRTGPDHHDRWASTATIIELNVGKGKYAGTGAWPDTDFLMTGGEGCSDDRPLAHCPGQTDTEYRTEFSLWCLMGSSLLVSTDIRNMTDVMKEVLLNPEMIAVNQDRGGTGGDRVGNWHCSEGSEYCQIWAKPLTDGSHAVGLYNAGSRAHSITFEFSLLKLTGSVAMRDLWKRINLGSFETSFTTQVESHGIEVFKVKESS